ncbi:MAG: bifunctional diguanylate cyclase/phosphodiesterase [Fusobacteriaceae bacterium]|nr:bifunctional diguanylate cyclase/phosphodiesterase [Fusobacteriaceae bacterium]
MKRSINKNNDTYSIHNDFKVNPIIEALIIMGIYGLFGVLWIWLSDKILSFLISDIKIYSQVQTLKGWFYVLITSFLIYFLVKTRSTLIKNSMLKVSETHKNLERVYNELLSAEEKLLNTIYFDSLTELSTRIGIEVEMEKFLENNIPFAFVHIDFDNFKYINETLGHSAGDQFLKEMGIRLKELKSDSFIVGRLSGDEFGIILKDVNSIKILKEQIDNINKLLGKKWTIGDYEFFTSASMGISVFPKDGSSKIEIFRSADLAMSRAKKEGKGRGIFYTGEILESNSEKIKISNQIQHAIEKKEFILYYQPQIYLNTGEIKGFEVLIRWNNPFSGFISPALFIPIAEETGQIFAIEKWIINNALKQKKILENKGYEHLDLSINLSSKTLMSNLNFHELEDILDENKVDYSHITLEVTETAIISDIEMAISRLLRLKRYGLKIALDDFGTGYSSLTYLKKMPIDTIKLDRSFVKSIEENDADTYIIKSILYLALDLKYNVVAEGIETEEQYRFLEKNNCESGQGFLMSKPVPIEDVYEKLENAYSFKL